MRINPLQTQHLRSEPVKYGVGSHGKRKLVNAVMDAGYSFRTANKAVNAVIAAWKQSLAAHQQVELPLGVIKVKKTPKNLFQKRYTQRKTGRDGVVRLYTWTTYKDRYRVIWRVPRRDDWRELLRALNSGITEEELDALCTQPKVHKPDRRSDALRFEHPRPAVLPTPLFTPAASSQRSVPSRTDVFRRRKS
jgi:hypothetical protein